MVDSKDAILSERSQAYNSRRGAALSLKAFPWLQAESGGYGAGEGNKLRGLCIVPHASPMALAKPTAYWATCLSTQAGVSRALTSRFRDEISAL